MSSTSFDPQELTKRNARIALLYADAAKEYASFVLLTGSNAWGADYAVTPASDIDLLIVTPDLEKIGTIVEAYVRCSYVEVGESGRYEAFSALASKGEADQFSLIATYEGVPVSIDFLPLALARQISALTPLRSCEHEGVPLRIVREFRENPPRASGYSLDDLATGTVRRYVAPYRVVADEKGKRSGYLADTVVDGLPDGGYVLGVMGFFFAIDPAFLVDTESEGSALSSEMRIRIQERIRGAPLHVTRRERMDKNAFERIRNSFSS